MFNPAYHHQLELLAISLNFLGGGMLSWDALSPIAKAYLEKGADKWADFKARHGESKVIRTAKPLASANRSQWLARLGVLVMTSGFLLDFLLKW